MDQARTDTAREHRSKVGSLMAPADTELSFDNVRILSDDLASTWTKTYNAANELTQMQTSAQGTTITFDYDAWGRTTEMAMGGNSANYAWRYGSKLHELTCTMPDEGNVSYEYGGDQKRRSREAGSDYTWYRWDNSGRVINEESAGNVLLRSIFRFAHADGNDPSLADYTYYLRTRAAVRATADENKRLSILLPEFPFPNPGGCWTFPPVIPPPSSGGSWNTIDFWHHYWRGRGEAVNLRDLGLLDAFRSHHRVLPGIRIAYNLIEINVITKARELAEKCEGSEIREGATGHNDKTLLGTATGWPWSDPFYSIGRGWLSSSSRCNVRLDCCSRKYSYTCDVDFDFWTRFEDPFGCDVEVGTPYDILADWSEQLKGGGSI